MGDKLHDHHLIILQVLQFRTVNVLPIPTYRPESCYIPSVLLRGIIFKSFSVPPNPASRFELSLAISACKPSLTREVFSVIPVNLAAFSSKLSSIFSVVQIGRASC